MSYPSLICFHLLLASGPALRLLVCRLPSESLQYTDNDTRGRPHCFKLSLNQIVMVVTRMATTAKETIYEPNFLEISSHCLIVSTQQIFSHPPLSPAAFCISENGPLPKPETWASPSASSFSLSLPPHSHLLLYSE